MSSSLREILWKSKAEDASSSFAQQQGNEVIQLEQKENEEEDAA